MAFYGFSAVKKWHTKQNYGWTKARGAGTWQQQGVKRCLLNCTKRCCWAPSPSQGDVLVCQGLEDWLQPECDMYNAMCVPRKQMWADMQRHIDVVADSGAFGELEALQEDIQSSGGWASEQCFAVELNQKARRIVDKATKAGLPAGLGRLIQNDYQQIATVMAQMAPSAKMIIKLDIMGESVCRRWHQDNYIARTVVSYNLSATEYIDDEYVNFWELRNGGANENIVRDTSKVCSAKVGDYFFMKGSKFPSGKGLVHKAPTVRYHPNGKVKNRLVLKVDLL